jgi:anion-transporting  ArsA/GET3 family ATPase
VGEDEHIPRLLAPERREPVGYAGATLAPGLHVMRSDPFAAMSEYLALQFGGRALVDFGLRNKALRQLLEGAPGWRELITLGKIWHVEQARRPDGRPVYDLIVVDAPATGHGLTFLDVPRVVHSAVRTGPLARNAALVESLVRDPERTLLLPVALAEELPVKETCELVARLTNEIGITVDRIVVNAVAPAPYPEELGDVPARLAALSGDLGFEVLPPPVEMAACTRHLMDRHRLNAHYVSEIAERAALPLVCLPLLPCGPGDPDGLDTLAEALLGEPERP